MSTPNSRKDRHEPPGFHPAHRRPYLAGELPEPEAARLSEALAEEADARRQFWEAASIDGLTQEAVRLAWLENATTQSPARVIRPPGWRILAVAAALALAALWFVRREEPTPVTGVAVLAGTVDSERAGGGVLQPGMLDLATGAALVEFYSGARVVLEAPVRFEVISADAGFLHAGKVTAHVPAQARGFTIGTPALTVVDLGTAFGLSVSPDAPPEVHVFEGLVEVAIGSGAPRPLHGGEAGKLEARGFRTPTGSRGARSGCPRFPPRCEKWVSTVPCTVPWCPRRAGARSGAVPLRPDGRSEASGSSLMWTPGSPDRKYQ
ncbi:hypothetical protein BH23VER1_BH23VER1_09850 [soil metagenome]